jgi:phosphocarrier protein
MLKATVTVANLMGLHARPATQFVALSQKFSSDIRLIKGGREFDAKSILSILSAGIKQGTAVELAANGDDEAEAIKQLMDLIGSLME